MIFITGHREKCGENWKKGGFCFRGVRFFPKSAKSAILAQKCEIMDFGQMVHNNAILLKYCNLVQFLPKSAGSHPHTFPDALSLQRTEAD